MFAIVSSPYWPFAVLLIGIVVVVILISRFKVHPFIALMLSAVTVGLISSGLPISDGMHPLVGAVELPMKEFGIVAGKITWVIALAAIIGTAMMESGAAQRIVNFLLKALGENRASIALLIGGFILSIPVFFDTVFFLLIPLAIALALKTGKNYVMYVIAIAGGAVITHSLVPPTPGPLIMAETLELDLGMTILAGIAVGIIPSFAVIHMGKRLQAKLNIPVRVAPGSAEMVDAYPGLLLSFSPVIIPLILISLVSIVNVTSGSVPGWMAFFGNKNTAMAIGTAIALWLWAKQQKLDASTLWKNVSRPLEIAGIIILITSAGGAFGAMIKHSGIGTAIELATENFHVHYIILAWVVAAIMKTAQGSGTVAMITASSIIYAIIGPGAELPFHPMYILLAIGFGSLFISWMNDSGFWVVAKMSGFTDKETLQSWTIVLAVISIIGLTQVILLSYLLPFR